MTRDSTQTTEGWRPSLDSYPQVLKKCSSRCWRGGSPNLRWTRSGSKRFKFHRCLIGKPNLQRWGSGSALKLFDRGARLTTCTFPSGQKVKEKKKKKKPPQTFSPVLNECVTSYQLVWRRSTRVCLYSSETRARPALHPPPPPRVHVQPDATRDGAPAGLPGQRLLPVPLPRGPAVPLRRLLHAGHRVWDLLRRSDFILRICSGKLIVMYRRNAIKEQFIRFWVLFQGCEVIRGEVCSCEMGERFVLIWCKKKKKNLQEIALQWSYYLSG